jgi:hypothetical protein
LKEKEKEEEEEEEEEEAGVSSHTIPSELHGIFPSLPHPTASQSVIGPSCNCCSVSP